MEPGMYCTQNMLYHWATVPLQGRQQIYLTRVTYKYKPVTTFRNLGSSLPALRRSSWSSQSVNINVCGKHGKQQRKTLYPEDFEVTLMLSFSLNIEQDDILLVSSKLKIRKGSVSLSYVEV